MTIAGGRPPPAAAAREFPAARGRQDRPRHSAIQHDASAKKWRASINAAKEQLKAAPEFKYQGQWEAGKS
jgi:hypothetical protein